MRIQGKDKFLKQIAALPKEMRAEIRKALEVSAKETTDVMRRFAPVDSGALRASIGYTFGEHRPENANVRGVASSDAATAARAAKQAEGLSVTMHAGDETAWYAALQEFGTVEMSANPFFFPGFRFGRGRAKSRLQRAIRAGAKKAFGQ